MRVHDNAFLALIRADPVLAPVVFEGTVKNRPDLYVSVFARESRSSNRYTGPHSYLDSEYVVHSVALSPEGAKSARERMLSRTLDVVPQIAGWSCRPVRFVTSQPLQMDRDTSPPLFYMVDVLAFGAQAV